MAESICIHTVRGMVCYANSGQKYGIWAHKTKITKHPKNPKSGTMVGRGTIKKGASGKDKLDRLFQRLKPGSSVHTNVQKVLGAFDVERWKLITRR